MYKQISLADAVEFIVDNRGKTVPVQEKGFPLIATNCISNDNLYPEFINVRYVSEEIYENWFRSHPKPDDVILTNKGSKNGAICMVPDPVEFCIAQDMVALRAKIGEVYSRYLFAVLRSELAQNRIKELNVDSVIPHFKKTDFNKLFFPLPNYEQQVRIGNCYFYYCQKIQINHQTNQTLESIAQAIFKSWFVDFDPVKAKITALETGGSQAEAEQAAMMTISAKSADELAQMQADDPEAYQQLAETAALFPAKWVESELGMIPEGWEVKVLSGICRVINGRAYKNSEFKDQGVPIVRIQNLSGKGKTVFSNLDLPDDKLIDKEDFIYAWSATFGPYIWRGEKSIYHYHIWKMDVDEQVISRYFLYLAMFRKTEAMKNAGTGSIFTHLTKKIMESQEILIGTCEINEVFKFTSEAIFRKISHNCEEITRLSNIRDTLLPKLLSGEIDLSQLPDPEAVN